jgi:spermidine/putrescine transport system substrate-binding protein
MNWYEHIQRLLIRVIIICFWVCAIGGFLILPQHIGNQRMASSITILAMPNSINADMLDDFEAEYGVKVHLMYAENADEIYVKLAMSGGIGYDLVMISDHHIPLLKESHLIQPLNKHKLPFFADIYPALLNHAFDPDNAYSIPYYWGVYGFAIDTTYFGTVDTLGWDAIFDESKISYCIGMREDPREIIAMAAFYCFGSTDHLDEMKYHTIKQLLVTQKKWVTMYADERIGSLLASHTCPLVVTLTGDIMRTMEQYPNIAFCIPHEGSFVDIDSFVIPAASGKEEMVYAFLNYLYTPRILTYYVDYFKLSSPLSTVASKATIPMVAVPTTELFEKLRFLTTYIPAAVLSDIILTLKTA